MLVEVLREIAGCYLALTLAATGLAKARAWRTTFLGVVHEGVIPRRLALPVTMGLCTAEIALAALVAIRAMPQAVGFATAALFVVFACYKVAVVARTGKDTCSCTGTTTMYKTTRPTVLASIASSLIQAACGFLWALGRPSAGVGFSLLTAIAFAVPFAALLAGSVGAGRKGSRMGQPA